MEILVNRAIFGTFSDGSNSPVAARHGGGNEWKEAWGQILFGWARYALPTSADGFSPFDNLHKLRYVFHGNALSSVRCVPILQGASEGS